MGKKKNKNKSIPVKKSICFKCKKPSDVFICGMCKKCWDGV